MAVLDRIRRWFYYAFIKGKDKRSESDQSIIGISQFVQTQNTLGDHLLIREDPGKVGSFYSKPPTLLTETRQK